MRFTKNCSNCGSLIKFRCKYCPQCGTAERQDDEDHYDERKVITYGGPQPSWQIKMDHGKFEIHQGKLKLNILQSKYPQTSTIIHIDSQLYLTVPHLAFPPKPLAYWHLTIAPCTSRRSWTMFCSSCGHERNERDNFCSYCSQGKAVIVYDASFCFKL